MSAYVYLIEEVPFIKDESGPWTKIGLSQNMPEWRMNANLKRGNPRKIRVAVAFVYESVEAAREAERQAHIHFSSFAGENGKEWFNVSWNQVSEWMISSGAQIRAQDKS